MQTSPLTRVAVYCRVSTCHAELADSLENQIRHYRELYADHPTCELIQIYYDFGISGFRKERPGFQQMLSDARARKFDRIVTKSVTRFARNTQTVLETVRELKRYGIDILFELQELHTLDPGGELMLTLRAAFGQAESDGASRRTRMAIRQKLLAGVPNQRLSLVFGYSRMPDGRILPDENAVIIRRIFELSAHGCSISGITRLLNSEQLRTKRNHPFRRSTVLRILRNEEYMGDFVQQKHFTDAMRRQKRNDGQLPMYYFEQCTPPIISPELWHAAQKSTNASEKTLRERSQPMAEQIRIIPARDSVSANGKPRKLRVAAYCRVSTEQEEQLGSFENQIEYYTKLIYSNPNYEMAGIFSDEGISGTGTKKRIGFQQMMKACREGKIDQILTKSISRFARNTADCLRYSRELKELGVNLIFEKEGISIMDSSGELLFTILSALAQEESRNISQNTQWGIRSRFRQGIPHINTGRFMGYDKDERGQLVVNEAQAAVVRRIFREYLDGWAASEIARHLISEQVPGVTGRAIWPSETIRKMLRNEKYKGDLLMQKYYTVDFLTKEQAENDGACEQYYVQNAHEAIVSEEDWTAVQQELSWRAKFRQRHQIRELGTASECVFFGKVFCAKCGSRMIRRRSPKTHELQWICKAAEVQKRRSCAAEPISDALLPTLFHFVWMQLLLFRDRYLPRWNHQLLVGTPLERHYARVLLELTERQSYHPSYARRVLAEIQIDAPQLARIVLKDGTMFEISDLLYTKLSSGDGGGCSAPPHSRLPSAHTCADRSHE